MIEYLFQRKEEGMLLIMKNNISRIAKWQLYILNSFSNFIFEVFNQRWAIHIDLIFSPVSNERNHKVLNSKISIKDQEFRCFCGIWLSLV